MSSVEAEKSSVITNLRACLISSQDGVPIKNLNRDYHQIIGEGIPFHRLGYKNVEDFLKTLPNITLQSKGGVTYVIAKASENTAGLISLVKGQKRSKKKIKPIKNVHIKQNRPPRYRRRPMAPDAPKRPEMKINVSQDIRNVTNRTVSLKQEVDENKNVRIDVHQVNKKASLTPTSLIQKPVSTNRFQKILDDMNETVSSGGTTPFIEADKRKQAGPYRHSVSFDSSTVPSKLSNRLKKNKSNPDLQKIPVKLTQEATLESKLSSRLKQAAQVNSKTVSFVNDEKSISSKNVSFLPVDTQQTIAPPMKQSAQSRLTRIPPPESKLVVVVDKQEGNKGCFYQSKLSTYVRQKNWPKEPSYVVYKQKSGKRVEKVCYACTVRVAIPRQSFRLPEEMFECSTFPNDFLTQLESKENAACLALEKLKEREGLVNGFQETDGHTIIGRIRKFVENKESGIWAQTIEDEYKNEYKQLLPNYWLDMLKVAEQFDVEELGPSYIVRLKDEPLRPPLHNNVTMPHLQFPAGTTWDLFITGGTSVSDVHLRFIGDEYSTRFEVFSSSLESWYENKANRVPANLAIGVYCAAYYEKSWWRVIITNFSGDDVGIKFIDHGDEEKINRSNLYKLEPIFYKIPPQAVSVSLKGLEEFATRQEAEDFLLKTIIGKSLVGVVESFQPNNISLTLYDTSHEEAVNLNETLRQLFELDYKSPPHLDIGSVQEMVVTNIELNGTVYIQIFNEGNALLQELMDFYEDIDFESMKDYSQIYKDKVYLALQHEDNMYYRVRPTNTSPVDSKVQVYCIDYGKHTSVFLEDLVFMYHSSFLLEEIPGQAIPVLLQDIPPSLFTPIIREKLQKLVSSDDPSQVIVGRVRDVKNGLPVVELFKRTVPDNLLVSINQTVVVEENLSLINETFDRLRISSPEKVRHPSLIPPIHLPNIVKPKKTTEIITRILAAYPAGAIEKVLAQNRPELPDIDEYFNIYVHSTASPSYFLINPSDFVTSLNKVMDDMNSYYNANKVQTILEEGSLCAAKDNNFWYRAYIDKVIDMENISVKVVDYGCVKIISSTNVKPLLDVFTKHPYIGFSAKVHGIVPVHGDWSVEDSITMKNLINKKTITAKLKDIIPDKQGLGGMTLSLELYATDNHGKEFHVAEHFVRQYNAKFE